MALEWYGTMVAVSASLVMPLWDSDIPMNVPMTFRNKQPITAAWRRCMLDLLQSKE